MATNNIGNNNNNNSDGDINETTTNKTTNTTNSSNLFNPLVTQAGINLLRRSSIKNNISLSKLINSNNKNDISSSADTAADAAISFNKEDGDGSDNEKEIKSKNNNDENKNSNDNDNDNDDENDENNVIPFYKIVLTGGPCGGKTTALERVSSYLRERGFQVITCPEIFTILSQNGMGLDYFNVDGMDYYIQSSVIDIQISIEDSLEVILRGRGLPSVLLCDRGCSDGSAYLSKDKWISMLNERQLNICDVREGRYNAVYHMLTAANGASDYYTLENNTARTETPSQAIQLDYCTQNAWIGHPKLTVIDNSTGFEKKLQRLINSVSKLVGLPYNLNRKTTKFLLKEPPNLSMFDLTNINYQIFHVEKVYLLPSLSNSNNNSSNDNNNNNNNDNGIIQEEYSFIRKRTVVSHLSESSSKDSDDIKDTTKYGGSIYGITIVQKTNDGKHIEKKRILTKREYDTAYKRQGDFINRHVIIQNRISFIYKQQSFSIHYYDKPYKVKNLCILHAQVEAVPNDDNDNEHDTDNDQHDDSNSDDEKEKKEKEIHVELPPFLNIDRRLNSHSKDDEMKYGAYSISLKKERDDIEYT